MSIHITQNKTPLGVMAYEIKTITTPQYNYNGSFLYWKRQESQVASFCWSHSNRSIIKSNNKKTMQIKTKEEAIQYAIEWQSWASEQDLSIAELAGWGAYFEELAIKFGLLEEFKENGII